MNGYVPVAVGVPVNRPSAPRARPGGRAPPVTASGNVVPGTAGSTTAVNAVGPNGPPVKPVSGPSTRTSVPRGPTMTVNCRVPWTSPRTNCVPFPGSAFSPMPTAPIKSV